MAVTIVQTQVLEYAVNQTFTPDATGRFQITGNVTSTYRQVSISVGTKGAAQGGTGIALTMHVEMLITGGPSGLVGQFPNDDGLIHTFPVVGSQFILYATGGIPFSQIPLTCGIFLN